MPNPLLLEEQLCFPFYAISREITKRYRPLLEPLGLTYPQYLVMLVLWEQDQQSLKAVGERLHLDSGTLTPLLKKLEASGLVERVKNPADERHIQITLTADGQALRKELEQEHTDHHMCGEIRRASISLQKIEDDPVDDGVEDGLQNQPDNA